jgi:TPR repeat protein
VRFQWIYALVIVAPLASPAAAASQSVRSLEASCNNGNGTSCVSLGHLYEKGLGVARDTERSALYLTAGCKDGVISACKTLVWLSSVGRGIRNDYLHVGYDGVSCAQGDQEACARNAAFDLPVGGDTPSREVMQQTATQLAHQRLIGLADLMSEQDYVACYAHLDGEMKARQTYRRQIELERRFRDAMNDDEIQKATDLNKRTRDICR